MNKAMLAVVATLLSLGAFAEEKAGSIPDEGRATATQILSGALQALPLGKDQARVSYDVVGARLGDASDPFRDSSVRCVGAMTVRNGSFDDESGNCVLTRPDGDQAFTSYKGSGRVGVEAKGTYTMIGGTGKLSGVTGSGEWTRYNVRPAVQGTSQSVLKLSGSYKLPSAAASR